jgi:hypothetical protein
VPDAVSAVAAQTRRQVAHWVQAASRLVLDDLAGASAWGHLERYLGLSVRRHLQGVVDRLQAEATALTALQAAADTPAALAAVHRRLLAFEQQYLRAETTLDFFADAINVRTNPQMAALLRACDTLAHRSMAQVLDAIGKPAPVALTYVDKGRGASILKAGLRLWDGGATCPVAVIKVTRHNLLRPTALIHEAGHQVAHIAGWNEELATALSRALLQQGAATELAQVWSAWASEIAADAFAFVHTGFASIAALHDVLAAGPATAYRYLPGDPHPISHLRVLLGVALCRHAFGAGGSAPWDALEQAWLALHPQTLAAPDVRAIVQASVPLLPLVAQTVLDQPMNAFGGRALTALVPPARVSPAALHGLADQLGPALFTSAHWLWSEPLRILGLTGLRLAETPNEFEPLLQQQQQSMLRLGGALQTS